MKTALKIIAGLLLPSALLVGGAAHAGTGHLGNVETLGIKTGMTHEEVRAALARIKKPWKESAPRSKGYYFDQNVGEVFEAQFTATDSSGSEELTLSYSKENALFRIQRTARWPAGARPALATAIKAVSDKYGPPTSQRVYSDMEQMFYYTLDGGKVITADDLPNKRGYVSDATKCFEFDKMPPSRFNNPGNLATQDVLYAKCGGSVQVILEPDNPNYPNKSPREIARKMDLDINDPRVFLAAAQKELFARQNKLQEQNDKAKTNGIKPVL